MVSNDRLTEGTGRKPINNPYTRLEGYNCFGCSPDNQLGLQLQFEEEGEFLVAEWEPKEHFSGYKKVLHGGIQATLLDEIASWTVQVKLRTAGVTAGLDLRFRKPVYVDEGSLFLKSTIEKVDKRIAFVHTQLFDHQQQLCCEGIVKYFIYPEEIAREQLYYPGFDKFFKPM